MLLGLCLVALAAKPVPPAPTTHEVDVEAEAPIWSYPPRRLDDGGVRNYSPEQLARPLKVAHAAAIDLALRREVSSRVAGEPELAENALVGQRIFKASSRFIAAETEVAQSYDDVNVKLKLHLTFDLKAIDEELAVVRRLVKLLRGRSVLLAIGEQSIGPDGKTEIATRETSQVIASALKAAGVPVLLDGAGRYESGSPKPEEIDQVAVDLHADEVLTGLVTMRRLPPGRGNSMIPERNEHGEQLMFFVEGDYRLELVEPGTRKTLFTLAGKFEQNDLTGIKTQLSYASTEVGLARRDGTRIASELIERMATAYSDLADSGQKIEVALSQINAAQLSAFQKLLKRTKGVSATGRAAELVDGAATLEVDFKGTPAELAKAITQAHSPLSINQVTKTRISLTPAGVAQ